MTLHLPNYLSLWIYQVNIVTSNIIVHRHYGGDKMINDIALIKLAKPVYISGKTLLHQIYLFIDMLHQIYLFIDTMMEIR